MSSTLEEVLEARRQGTSAHAAAEEKLAALREQISAGTYSTGNKIRDFLIAAYGIMEQPELEAKMRSLSDDVDAHRGEQMLLVGERYEKDGEDGCFSSANYLLKGRYLQLGVVNGNLGFNLPGKQLIIPAEKRVTLGNIFGFHSFDYDQSWKLTKEPLTIDSDRFLTSETRLKKEYSLFEVLVGTKKVESYFQLHQMHRETTISLIEEGHSVRPEFLSFQRRWLDLSYVEALELLGLEVPYEFRITFDQQSDERQKAIFQEIYASGEP